MNPMEKIVIRAIFFFRVVRTLTMTGIGRAKSTRSVTMLEELTKYVRAVELKHSPLTVRSQNAFSGRHNAPMNASIMVIHIRTNIEHPITVLLNQGMGKMR